MKAIFLLSLWQFDDLWSRSPHPSRHGRGGREGPRWPGIEQTPEERHRGVGKRVIVGLRERGGSVRAAPEFGTSRQPLYGVVQRNVEQGSAVFTNEHSGYTKPSMVGYNHGTVNHSAKE